MSTQGSPKVDEACLQTAKTRLCEVFDIPSLRTHQEAAALNIIRGQSTIYDVPTGGGKTLAFYLSLFYHWDPQHPPSADQKSMIVVSPLNALMDAQKKALEERGIPATALNSGGGKAEDIFGVHLRNALCVNKLTYLLETRGWDQVHQVSRRFRLARTCALKVVSRNGSAEPALQGELYTGRYVGFARSSSSSSMPLSS
ncbi:hypothetical protein D9758_001461 [Tetrapyrgos nigripes]|uniref:DNA 3'-5' helicase n=1 Tax=Tetrapyrgos nigripes TaxID=182062 RepID=A0A8H5GXT2_9AGAR|nr:hypothetical protein D9758_001461 [Tetrapyrgos nigripes]